MKQAFVELYPILEKRVEAVRRQDVAEVSIFHEQFSRVWIKYYFQPDFPDKNLLVRYDSVANSCICAAARHPGMWQTFTVDLVEQEFSQIQQP